MISRNKRIIFITALCIFLNLALKHVVQSYSVPFWMDSVGTLLAAYLLGPFAGAVIGASTNVIYSISDPMSLFYAATSIAVGITIGILARRGCFEKLFETLTACTMLTVISAVISTVINCILYHGSTGNIWGDGIGSMLVEFGFNWIPASFVAEFFLDFLDKFLSMMIIYAVIRIVRIMRKSGKINVSTLLIYAVLCLSLIAAYPAEIYAASPYVGYSKYVQTIYNQEKGLFSGEANDIAATDDGIIWIGTYAGLYRYSGNEFQYIRQFENVKNVNCLYVDIEGRLWIGTNDDGLSICIDENVVNTFNEDNGFASNSVRSIVQCSDGNYYIGTSGNLAIISLTGGVNVIATIPSIKYASNLTANNTGLIGAVTATGQLFLAGNCFVKDSMVHPEGRSFTCCQFITDDFLYAGDDSGNIYIYDVSGGKLNLANILPGQGLRTLNEIYKLETGDIFLLADNGIAWIDPNGEYHPVNTNSFSSSIDRMTVDYQGNLWFASSRLGVLKLTPSSFIEVYSEANLDPVVVNAIAERNGCLYFGTDKGMDAVTMSNHTPVENKITEYFGNSRIRHIMVDSKNHMWVCAYGIGAVCIDDHGDFKVYNSANGALGSKFRSSLELSDGSYAISSDMGVTFIKDGKVTGTIGAKEGLKTELVLCLMETADGKVLAGTDGGGIAVIEDGKIVSTITRREGLGSSVILRMVKNEGTNDFFIVTSNGICYLDENLRVRELSFPYSNNYNILDAGDGSPYVTGSAGIYIVNKEALIEGNLNAYTNLNYLSGLRATFTANAWNYVDGEGNWYIASDNGVTQMDLSSASKGNIHSYRMLLSKVTIDHTDYSLHGTRTITMPRGASTLQITPEIINYSTSEPYVCYYMEDYKGGEKTTVLQSELNSILYTALSAGSHKFHLSILDEPNGKVIEEIVYDVVKETEIYDHAWFKAFFFVELMFITIWFTWFITRKLTARTMELQKREIALAKEQVRMGNETILAIARTVDAKDANTSEHSVRVAEYSVLIAERLGYSEEAIENLRKTALLHDIGKIGIPDSVLNKPGRLTDEEYAVMKSHVTRGAEILKDFTLVTNVHEGVLYHHERYDGSGYASGLSGKDIPETARIVGVADAFDAMTANRVYRKKLNLDYVISELKNGRGKQFDPDITNIMLDLIAEGKIDVNKLYEEGN